MVEDIALCVETAGTVLTFSDFEIYGIPGFETTVLYKGEATQYEIEKQRFSFQCATADIVENNIILGMPFTMTDEFYEYSFKISNNPRFDLTGWSKLEADYIGKILV